MNRRAMKFRKGADQENRGRRGAGRRYSPPLRAEAVAYYEARRQEGVGLSRVAEELGTSALSLSRWVESPRGSARWLPVQLTGEPEPLQNGVVLVTPDGYRVEGLDEWGARRLLEALR